MLENGYKTFEEVLPLAEIQGLRQILNSGRLSRDGVYQNKSATYAIRNLFQATPQLLDLAKGPVLSRIAQDALGDVAWPVKATLFDKIPGANWRIPWHQDKMIAIQEI